MLIRALTCSLLVSCAASGFARASSISVVAGNAQPEQLGWRTSYTVINTVPNYQYTQAWTIQQTDCTPASQPRNMGGSGPLITYGIPGTFQLQCVITYMANGGGVNMQAPPAAETVTRSVIIPYPSIVAILGPTQNGKLVVTPYCNNIPPSNAGNPTANSLGGEPGLWVYFVLQSGGKTIGPLFWGVTVQEDLSNFVVYNMPRPDSGWIPAAGSTSTSYYLGQSPQGADVAICDFKTFTLNGAAQIAQIGSYTQDQQITWKDSNGNPVTVDLGSDDWTFEGTTTANGAGWFANYQ